MTCQYLLQKLVFSFDGSLDVNHSDRVIPRKKKLPLSSLLVSRLRMSEVTFPLLHMLLWTALHRYISLGPRSMVRDTRRVSWPPGSPDDKPADRHFWANLNDMVYSKRRRTICSAITDIFWSVCDTTTTYACNFPAYVELLVSKAFLCIQTYIKYRKFLWNNLQI